MILALRASQKLTDKRRAATAIPLGEPASFIDNDGKKWNVWADRRLTETEGFECMDAVPEDWRPDGSG